MTRRQGESAGAGTAVARSSARGPAPLTSDNETLRARLGAVQASLRAGELEAGGRLAEEAIAEGHDNPMLFSALAAWREREGRYEEALALLRRAKESSPNLAVIRNGIGLYLIRLGQFEEAVTEYDEALAIDPRFANALANRAMALVALDKLNEARRDFEAAAAIDPANLIASNGLAGLALRRGDAADARRLARRVLALAPGFPGASITLAGAELALGELLAAETNLRSLLASGPIDPRERSNALGLLGDTLDEQGKFTEAFEAWREANAELARLHRDDWIGQGRTLALVRELTASLAGRSIPRDSDQAAGRGQARRHVFLIGFPRSGTTLVEQALEEHPDVITMAERECLIDAARDYLTDVSRFAAFCDAADHDLAPYRTAYWRRVREQGIDPAGRVFVDKHPFNTFRLPLIARLFPDARILIVRRDPRDVVLSCFRHRFRMSAPVYQMLTLEGAAALYAATMLLAEASEAAFALHMHSIQMEALIADFEGETKSICAFLGIEWRAEMRDFAVNVATRGVFTPSSPQLVRGLNAKGVGKWRDYAARIEQVMPILMPWVERFGAS